MQRTTSYIITLKNDENGEAEFRTLQAANRILNRTRDVKLKIVRKGRGSNRLQRFIDWKMRTENLTEAEVIVKYSGPFRSIKDRVAQDLPIEICDYFDVYIHERR